MDELSKDYLISFYNNLLKRHGDSPEALRWTPKGQMLRYHQLLEIGTSIDGASILDFGCGKGDFLGFMKAMGIEVKYTGLDINQKLIELAKKKYPDGWREEKPYLRYVPDPTK